MKSWLVPLINKLTLSSIFILKINAKTCFICTLQLKTWNQQWPNMATASEPPEDPPEAVNRMLFHIANSGAIVKSQQRGEEEISTEEKHQLLLDMWRRNPVTFLERFNRWLREDDLECFDDLSHGYEVNFYLREVRKRLDKDKSAVSIRNRRYEALKKLEREGKFFSDDEMKARDPLMFEQLIGQYQTDEERNKPIDTADLRFSSILTNFIDEQEIKEMYGRDKEIEDDMMEEEDSDEDEEQEEEEEEESDDEGINLKLIVFLMFLPQFLSRLNVFRKRLCLAWIFSERNYVITHSVRSM